jgi:hypothetical protein
MRDKRTAQVLNDCLKRVICQERIRAHQPARTQFVTESFAFWVAELVQRFGDYGNPSENLDGFPYVPALFPIA